MGGRHALRFAQGRSPRRVLLFVDSIQYKRPINPGLAMIQRIAFALLILIGGVAQAEAAERTVVYVLFDGFSPAELDAAHPTPNFDRMKREGAWSRHLVPAF